jgi:hypothetical protein
MARALTFARTLHLDIEAQLRAAIVAACGLALVLAGQPLPL